MSELTEYAIKAKSASHVLMSLDTEIKNKALDNIAFRLSERKEDIFKANKIDLDAALESGLDEPLFKRLKYDEHKLEDSVLGIKSLIDLEDPVGKVSLHTTLDDGLELYRVSCPIGVIGVIFESRPDALVQIASLCLKSGNTVFLKGGSEALNTNKVLAEIIHDAGVEAGLPSGWIHLLTTRADVNEMLNLSSYLDLIIPRGSNEFVKYIMNNTSIPVMGHADGVCHTYLNSEIDFDTAIKVTIDAKTQYVSVCNATETILVDEELKETLLPVLIDELKAKGVELYGDSYMVSKYGAIEVNNWHHEYLDMKVAIKIVNGLEDAINHINQYASGHTDAIITTNMKTAETFMNSVDSGSVLVNCSTRFADGFRYGFGAEVGISTSKIHARGPVGLEGLMSYKYKLYGNGNIVGDYASGEKTFKHIKHNI